MRFKVGDKVQYHRALDLHGFITNCHYVFGNTKCYFVKWTNDILFNGPFADSELHLIIEPNDLLKELL